MRKTGESDSNPSWLRLGLVPVCIGMILLWPGAVMAQTTRPASEPAYVGLARSLADWHACINGAQKRFAVNVLVETIEGAQRSRRIRLQYERFSDTSFAYAVDQPGGAMAILHDRSQIILVLPRHGRVLVGRGEVPAQWQMNPTDLPWCMLGRESSLMMFAGALRRFRTATIAMQLVNFLGLTRTADSRQWRFSGRADLSLVVDSSSRLLVLKSSQWAIAAKLILPADRPGAPSDKTLFHEPLVLSMVGKVKSVSPVPVDRTLLQKTLIRAVARSTELTLPSVALRRSLVTSMQYENSQLSRQAGRRLLVLQGTPDQVGAAHGRLMGRQVRMMIDSLVYLRTLRLLISEGRWVGDDLARSVKTSWAQVPEPYRIELNSLAQHAGVPVDELVAANLVWDQLAGTGYVAGGRATLHGRSYLGMVMTDPGSLGLNDGLCVVEYRVDGRQVFVCPQLAGMVSVRLGVNAKGLAAACVGGGLASGEQLPLGVMVRLALEQGQGLGHVQQLCRQVRALCSGQLIAVERGGGVWGVSSDSGQVSPMSFAQGMPDLLTVGRQGPRSHLVRRWSNLFGLVDMIKSGWLLEKPVASGPVVWAMVVGVDVNQYLMAMAQGRKPGSLKQMPVMALSELFGDRSSGDGPAASNR